MAFQRITLEMSLKPFRDLRPAAVEAVCRELFRQWDALHRHADAIAVMLWSADGSEILDYAGNLEDEFAWARLIGIGNPRGHVGNDPQGECLHSTPHPYCDDAPAFTYGDLKRVVETLRQVGQAMTGKPVEIGATFDPGGEFAPSSFKYERHPEICMADTMGAKTFVCCYATLNADERAYAGFPEGIAQDTSLGTFLGRQSRHFLGDLGFDYLWLSNGFGFGLETWKATGPMFDGQRFDPAEASAIREKNLGFWRDFRRELPDVPVEVRGTNLGTGSDLATDAVPMREIYEGGFAIRDGAPNSPWAAINGDFGIEMVGYMSRIAELPPNARLPFRYYVHDPWWLNSPWLDRYGREPHDIYLPLAVSRITGEGRVQSAETVALLTVDDSYGRMPVQCPNEVTPHLLHALATAPDEPGPLTWIYPYDEFHDFAIDQPARLPEAFFNDWFMRAAINGGLPLNTVVSSRSFVKTAEAHAGLYRRTVLVSLVPDAGSACEAALLAHVRRGGRALLYGPTDHASEQMLALLHLTRAQPVEGKLAIHRARPLDASRSAQPGETHHRSHLSAGAITTTAASNGQGPAAEVLATVTADDGERPVALTRPAGVGVEGAVAWVRGSNTSDYHGGHILTPDDPATTVPGDALLREALGSLGLSVGFDKHEVEQPHATLAISRHQGALWFAGYMRDTTVAVQLAMEDGVPLLVGCDARLRDGRGHYHFPRAWRRECRVLVEQAEEGVVSCHEQHSGHVGITRRLRIEGLRNATVRFLPPPDATEKVIMQVNPKPPLVTATSPVTEHTAEERFVGPCLTVQQITGTLLISW